MGTIFYPDLFPYEEPNLPWADGERPDRSTLNPYGFWNGKYVKDDEPLLCRYTMPLYLCSLCGDNTSPDPTGIEKWSVIIAHWGPFPIGIFALWCVYVRFDLLKERIYSPFLLLVSIFNLGVGSMAEADSHYFTMNWNACYDSAETFAKLYFYIFIGSGFAIQCLSLRKAGVPLIRTPSGACDWFFFVLDLLLIFFTILTPIVWALIAQKPATTMFIVTQSIAAICCIPRVYSNLGPSTIHLVGGILCQVIAVVGAIPIVDWLTFTGNQYIHVLLAFTFVLNEGGIFYLVYIMVDPKKAEAGRGENAPLI